MRLLYNLFLGDHIILLETVNKLKKQFTKVFHGHQL